MFSELTTNQDISKLIITKENWGAYVIVDDFLNQSLFNKLCRDYNILKKDRSIFSQENLGNVWRKDEENGKVFLIGSAGEDLKGFKEICRKSPNWNNLMESIYSESAKSFFLNIFSKTDVYESYISEDDKNNGKIGCKLSSQTNNFGDRIHQDTTSKVLSFLLYLDKDNWNDNSEGGTDLWEVTSNKINFDESSDSIDSQLRAGKNSPKSHSISHEESSRIRKFRSVEFKPNRLLGFIRTENSYHSVNPRLLPKGVTRDCLQINLWNFNRKSKFSYTQKLINFSRKFF